MTLKSQKDENEIYDSIPVAFRMRYPNSAVEYQLKDVPDAVLDEFVTSKSQERAARQMPAQTERDGEENV